MLTPSPAGATKGTRAQHANTQTKSTAMIGARRNQTDRASVGGPVQGKVVRRQSFGDPKTLHSGAALQPGGPVSTVMMVQRGLSLSVPISP
mmetsp:Transcript_12584/g.22801  ORF Transcript_12584/g.22801 Transcript_12584/m.22801 type:complete len:91 (-) Transcript_12584:316-588(-)